VLDIAIDNLIRSNNDQRKLHFRLWLIHFSTRQDKRVNRLLPVIICHQVDDAFPVFESAFLASPACV
jgi:hypothetical protein